MKKFVVAVLTLWGLGSLAQAEVVLDVEGMTVYGQHELPKVLYVVPWKRKDAPELDAPQAESLATDVLKPIAPDIFKRQSQYYELMSSKVQAD